MVLTLPRRAPATTAVAILAVLLTVAGCSNGADPSVTGTRAPGTATDSGPGDEASEGQAADEADTPPPWAGGPPQDATEDPDEFFGDPEGFRVSSEPITQPDGIVRAFTCDGPEAKFPPFIFEGVPDGTASLAIVILDVSAGERLLWQITAIPADIGKVEGGTIPQGAEEGENAAGTTGYDPPCPEPGATHEYVVRAFALSEPVAPASPAEAAATYAASALATAELRGTYQRPEDAGEDEDEEQKGPPPGKGGSG